MDRKSKILLWIIIIILVISVGVAFYKYVIKKDYTITTHLNCDPNTESCFYVPCENSDCSTETEYYKLINKKAFNIDLCTDTSQNCEPLVCKNGEEGCEIISCTSDNVSGEKKCSIPKIPINDN